MKIRQLERTLHDLLAASGPEDKTTLGRIAVRLACAELSLKRARLSARVAMERLKRKDPPSARRPRRRFPRSFGSLSSERDDDRE